MTKKKKKKKGRTGERGRAPEVAGKEGRNDLC